MMSTDFTITPLAGLFKQEAFLAPQGAYSQAAIFSATMLSHSTLATTAYSQEPICTWMEWSKELLKFSCNFEGLQTFFVPTKRTPRTANVLLTESVQLLCPWEFKFK